MKGKGSRTKEGNLAVKKNESARRLLLCINAVLQKKAKNIILLNVKEISSFTDYMLICSGSTDRQVQAISSAIQEYLKKEEIRPLGVEGESNAEWILLDYDDVVISVFQDEARSFYGLEDLWDAPRMEIDENATEIKKLTKDMA
jgi:ribosome-associated protein